MLKNRVKDKIMAEFDETLPADDFTHRTRTLRKTVATKEMFYDPYMPEKLLQALLKAETSLAKAEAKEEASADLMEVRLLTSLFAVVVGGMATIAALNTSYGPWAVAGWLMILAVAAYAGLIPLVRKAAAKQRLKLVETRCKPYLREANDKDFSLLAYVINTLPTPLKQETRELWERNCVLQESYLAPEAKDFLQESIDAVLVLKDEQVKLDNAIATDHARGLQTLATVQAYGDALAEARRKVELSS